LVLAACNKPTEEKKETPESNNKISEPYFQVSSGTLTHIEAFPSKHITPRNIEIWLPEGYDENKKYAVLYMHDGQMLFDSTKTWNKQEWGVDEVMGKLQKEGQVKPVIVVGIWNIRETRHSDYFPQKPFMSLPEAYRDSLLTEAKRHAETPLFAIEVRSDDYLKFIVKELKPYIDQNYATLPDAANTFIAGSSMGGLISMYAICEYPQVFSRAACISTHWPGTFTLENNPIPQAFMDYLAANLPDPASHHIYYGTETLDSMYEPLQLAADKIMEAKGYSNTNWKTMKFEGAEHSEKSWHARLDIPFKFLLEE